MVIRIFGKVLKKSFSLTLIGGLIIVAEAWLLQQPKDPCYGFIGPCGLGGFLFPLVVLIGVPILIVGVTLMLIDLVRGKPLVYMDSAEADSYVALSKNPRSNTYQLVFILFILFILFLVAATYLM